MNEMNADDPRPRMHPVNVRRWRSGSSGRPLTPRRGSRLGLLERDARPEPRPGLTPSTTDELIADAAVRDAQARIDRVGLRGRITARRTDRLASRAAALRRRAGEVRSAPARSPSGAALDPQRRRDEHDRLHTDVEQGGEFRHRRVSRGHRLVAAILPWIDALLFGYFVAGVSNADLAAPWSTPVASLVALAFTTFLVLTVAVFTPWLGHGLRIHKDTAGRLRFAELGPVAHGLLMLWAVLVLAIGLTMFVRVRTEASYAGAEPLASTAVALLLALASVVMTAYVLGVAIADGTPHADDLRAHGRVEITCESRARRLERRARDLEHRRLCAVRAAHRREARDLVRAGAHLTGVDRTVDLVRLRVGAPAERARPARRGLAELDQQEIAAVRSDLHSAPFE